MDEVLPGETVTYTVEVTNVGDVPFGPVFAAAGTATTMDQRRNERARLRRQAAVAAAKAPGLLRGGRNITDQHDRAGDRGGDQQPASPPCHPSDADIDRA